MKKVFKYLFVDDRWIARSNAVHRQPGFVTKHSDNPLISPKHPWEEGLKCYGTAIYENGRFRLWYQALAFRKRIHPIFETAVGYAESDDGLNWERPLLGVQHPQFGKTHWLLLSSGRAHLCSPSVVSDVRKGATAQRYKMMYFDAMDASWLRAYGSPFPPDPAVTGWGPVEGEGIFVAFSEDGLQWQKHPFPVIPGPNDVVSVSQREDGTYLATFKTSNHPERHFRILGCSSSRDFIHWSPPRIILEPDWHDPFGTEFYGMSSFEYCGNLLGLICVYHNSPDNKSLDIQIASSADGQNWQRSLDRRPLIEVGPRGSWDAGGLYIASVPIVSPPQAPEEIWFYYSGISARHDDMRFKEWQIGLASLRLDGFAVMHSGYFKSWLQTVPLKAISSKLRVNANCRHGWLRVSIYDGVSNQLLAESDLLEYVNSIELVPNLNIYRPLNRREVSLVFEMQKCDLYSFWFEPAA